MMGLFEKGEASSTFVQSGKVMAFDTALYSYEEFTMFYGNVALPPRNGTLLDEC